MRAYLSLHTSLYTRIKKSILHGVFMKQINFKNLYSQNFSFYFLQILNFFVCYLFFWKDIHISFFVLPFISLPSYFLFFVNKIDAIYYSVSLFSTYSAIVLFFSIKRKFFRNLLLLFFFSVELLTLFGTLKFGQLSSSMILASIGTDLNLVLSTAKLYGNFYIFLFFVAIFLVIFVILSAKNKQCSHNEKTIAKFSILLALTLPIFVIFIGWSSTFAFNNIRYSPTFIGNYYLKCVRVFWGPLISLFFIGIEVKIDSIRYKHILHKNIHNSISTFNNNLGDKNIILVIGESSNPNYFSIYNPKISTTPRIKRLQQQNIIYVFDKVHSQASQTRTAVPMIVSFYSPLEKDMLFNTKNIIELAHNAGYTTYWIDAQNGFTLWNKTFGFIAKYANYRATSDKNNNSNFKIKLGNDDSLIPAIKFYFQNKKYKNFYVIHLYGNHMPYESNVDKYDIQTLPNLDNYERSIHHTDKIVSNILQFAEKYLKEYELIFIADHGEIKNIGHGIPTTNNEMYLVPCFMKKTHYCSALESFRRQDGWLSSIMIKFIVLQMMGYSLDKKYMYDEILKSKFILDEKEDIIDFNKLGDSSIKN